METSSFFGIVQIIFEHVSSHLPSLLAQNYFLWFLFVFLSIFGWNFVVAARLAAIIYKNSFQSKFLWRMAGVMLQAIPSFYSSYSQDCLFISSEHYENFLVTEQYCVAYHGSEYCPLINCKFHILLIAKTDIKELFTKLDGLCYTYQYVDCFYTLFKYRFSGMVLIRRGQLFSMVERAVCFNKHNKGVEKSPSIARKRLIRKKFKKQQRRSWDNTCSSMINRSVLKEGIEKVRKTKYQTELLKIIDCFLDGSGNFESNLVSFKLKSLI